MGGTGTSQGALVGGSGQIKKLDATGAAVQGYSPPPFPGLTTMEVLDGTEVRKDVRKEEEEEAGRATVQVTPGAGARAQERSHVRAKWWRCSNTQPDTRNIDGVDPVPNNLTSCHSLRSGLPDARWACLARPDASATAGLVVLCALVPLIVTHARQAQCTPSSTGLPR